MQGPGAPAPTSPHPHDLRTLAQPRAGQNARVEDGDDRLSQSEWSEPSLDPRPPTKEPRQGVASSFRGPVIVQYARVVSSTLEHACAQCAKRLLGVDLGRAVAVATAMPPPSSTPRLSRLTPDPLAPSLDPGRAAVSRRTCPVPSRPAPPRPAPPRLSHWASKIPSP